MKADNKKVYQIDLNGFFQAEQNYKTDIKPKQVLAEKYKEITGKKITDYQASLNEVVSYLEQHPDNLMKLSATKFADLKGIDIYGFNNAYSNCRFIAPPNEDDFKICTKNDAEQERLEDFKSLMKEYTYFANKYGLNKNSIAHILKSIVTFNHGTNTIEPTKEFITNNIFTNY
jgi:hypothetical protein